MRVRSTVTEHFSDEASPVALERIYRDHYLRLVRLAVLLVSDRESAHDIVQNIFARMIAKGTLFAEEASAIAYIRASILNEAKNWYRKDWTRRAKARLLGTDDAAKGADELVISSITRSEVHDAIQQLTTRQRQVIVLRFLEELSVAETAQALRLTPGAVKTASNRAVKSLALKLGK